MKKLRTLALFLTPLLVLSGVALGAGWHALSRDCYRAGEQVGFVGCIVRPGPQLDWTRPRLRPHLWTALRAPDWALLHDASEVREGAAWLLLGSARPADEAAVVRAARSRSVSARMAAVHLACCWLRGGERLPGSVRELLEGDERDSALAVLALATVTGRGLASVARSYDERRLDDTGLDSWLAASFGRGREGLVADWTAWLAADGGESYAALHRDALAGMLATEWAGAEAGSPSRAPEALWVGWELVSSPRLAGWRAAVGLEAVSRSSTDWFRDLEGRRELARRVRAAEPRALTPEELLELFCLRTGVWF